MGKTGKRQRPRETVQPAAKQALSGRHTWRLAAVWGLLLIAYSNSFQSGLVFDNASILAQDPRIRAVTPRNIESILTGGYRYTHPHAGLYRPLTTLSYLLNYAVLGNGSLPAGYHWINLVVHGLNVALVYALGIAIFGEIVPAWLLAAVWGLHPVLTESVTNIIGRAELLAAFGVLVGLLCHVRATSTASRWRLAWLAGIAAAQAVGLFSKESAVVLPGLMLLYDFTRSREPESAEGAAQSDRAVWRRRAPAYAALLLPFATFFYLRSQAHLRMLIPSADNPLVNAGFWTARLTAVSIIGNFLWLFLWPARLSADYSYNAVPLFDWRDAQAFVPLAVCVGAALLLLILAVRGRGTRKPMLFFLAFFFVAVSPTSNLVVFIGSIMAERFLYLPSVGLAACMVAAAYVLVRRKPRLAWAAIGLICVTLSARTYARNSDWKDELSLWTSAVNVCPGSAKAHYNLGKVLEVLPGRSSDAIAEYRISIRIDPNHADVHTNLANALSAMPGRLPEAIAEYRAALRIEPHRAEPHNDLANALARIPGRLPEAIVEYQTALRIEPGSAEIHYNLANALIQEPGEMTAAIDEYLAALRIDPDHADAHINLGHALAQLPRLPEAIAEYRSALRTQPDSVGAHISLGNALSMIAGGLSEAIAEYKAAVRIRPDNAEAHYDLGTALAQMPGRLPEAIGEFESALRCEPNLVEAHVNLANALARIPGRTANAIAEYEAALRLRPDPVVREMANRLRAERR
jgi:tetratricopeptide (TPR) repeat protein